MNFEFNENQNDLRMMVRELAEKEIGPRAKENDEKDVFPVDLFKMMADMGLTGIGVPEEYGGDLQVSEYPRNTADPKQQTSKE